ncbi:type II toxin-antitoxin system VapC family toxin [Propionivibrio sp.]|uniref:type II toxin-antitoxin system VapC family toxin n=1 Tax=Propionivibrio sp. TaxID=2212460 RepID=UPI003BF3D296
MVIDASVWVAAFLARDAHHLDAAVLLRRLVEEGITVTTPLLALSEVAGAIARQTDDSGLAEKITAFLHIQPWIQFVPLTDDLAMEAATSAAQQRLRGADAVYVALAAQRTLTLVTLDREMLERTKEVVTSVTPTDWLKQHG